MTTLSPELESALAQIEADFHVSSDLLQRATARFVEEMEVGLREAHPRGLPMLPTFVRLIPDGTEKGTFLAADLGGTNFRVCSVELDGKGDFDLQQLKFPVPAEFQKGSADTLFDFLASKVEAFVAKFHGTQTATPPGLGASADACDADGRFKLGFTFLFPVQQTALDRGTLVRWTKGFDIAEAVDQDVVALLQQAIDKRKVPVHVVALANDTVGTLLARGYSLHGSGSTTAIGAIFGTGTNGAYLEKLANITKLGLQVETLAAGGSDMVVNTEWGSFDNELKVLPNTKYDAAIDKETANPGVHLFEKRILGMFLGEVVRNVLVDLYERGFVFQQYRERGRLPHRLTTAWELPLEVLSHIEIDDSGSLKELELGLLQALRLPTTLEERVVVQRVTRAASARLARLSAIPIAGILLKTRGAPLTEPVEVGVDGSVVEFYPGFKETVVAALLETPLGASAKLVTLEISKDGSGVGAALCASTT